MPMESSLNDILEEAKNLLKGELSELSYKTWLLPLEIQGIENNNVILISDDPFKKESVESRFKDLLENAFSIILQKKCTVTIVLNNENDTQDKTSNFSNVNYSKTYLNPNYSFDTFVVGDNNRFAHAAALVVAESPGTAYNPLYIYGAVGLGKTHLMHAIGNEVAKRHKDFKILYVTSENFMNEFINSLIKDNGMENFRNKYRNIDLLLIDDIQFIAGKERIQEEFFHTFNQLHDSNKQIIIASDRSVDDLKMLENRLITRFNWGLTANITPPDFGLRVDIIKRKIAHQEAAEDIPIEVIEYIANINDSDVRQLEGAITRVFAYALMMNHGIVTLDIAIEALKDKISERSVYKNDIHRIQRIVCEYFKIDIEDLKGKKRSKDINYQRQIAIYLCRIMTNESYPKMGTYFGGRDHSTIISAYQKIEKDLETNYQLQTVIEELKKRI